MHLISYSLRLLLPGDRERSLHENYNAKEI
jgi:hypothetical protein